MFSQSRGVIIPIFNTTTNTNPPRQLQIQFMLLKWLGTCYYSSAACNASVGFSEGRQQELLSLAALCFSTSSTGNVLLQKKKNKNESINPAAQKTVHLSGYNSKAIGICVMINSVICMHSNRWSSQPKECVLNWVWFLFWLSANIINQHGYWNIS